MADAGSSALPSFFCPLTLDLMRDPVFTEDGQTFEREPIEQWLALHDTSPVTGAALSRTRLVPNLALRQAIEQWQESHGMHVRRPDIAMDAQPVAVGSFKTVFRGTLRVHMRGEASRNITVAVLKMRRGDCATEVRSFIKLGRHPRLVRFLGHCIDGEDQLLLTEFAPLGSLSEAFETWEDTITLAHHITMMQQITQGMEHLIAEGLIHRDLAARNVLVFSYDAANVLKTSVKVTDYGLSAASYNRSHVTLAGRDAPVRYMPPEALQRGRFSEKSDVWALGVTFWEMLTFGMIPFFLQARDGDVIAHVCGGGRLRREDLTAECPEALWELIASCWAAQPKDRPTFAELAVALGTMLAQSQAAAMEKLTLEKEELERRNAELAAAAAAAKEEEQRKRKAERSWTTASSISAEAGDAHTEVGSKAPRRGEADEAFTGTGVMSDGERSKPVKIEAGEEGSAELQELIILKLKSVGLISLGVQDGIIVYFKIKRKTQLKKVMVAYSNRHSLPMDSLRFSFDGNRLRETQTPEELGMEDDDVIDVTMFWVGDIGIFGQHRGGVGVELLRDSAKLEQASAADAGRIIDQLCPSGTPDVSGLVLGGDELVLDACACSALMGFVDQLRQARDARVDTLHGAHDEQVDVSELELAALVGARHVAQLKRRYGSTPDRMTVRRVDASGQANLVAFHTDTGSLRTMQVALNRQGSDYGGGSLVFATRDGLLTPERPPGSYTMHHWCVPHGVTALRWGARYSLFLQTARRPFAAG